MKWLNKPPPQVEMCIHRNVSAYSSVKFTQEKEEQATTAKDKNKQMLKYLKTMEAQPFNSPLSAIGATNYLFEQKLREVTRV